MADHQGDRRGRMKELLESTARILDFIIDWGIFLPISLIHRYIKTPITRGALFILSLPIVFCCMIIFFFPLVIVVITFGILDFSINGLE
jgi:hypothetical protein